MSGQEPPSAALRPGSGADAADLAVFLSRAVRLDPGALVRLRLRAGRVIAYVLLPFGVLVSRSAAGEGSPADVTVAAGALLAGLDRVPVGQPIALPPRRDPEWRGALPPTGDWQRLDAVPAGVVRQLVRAGGEMLRAAGPVTGAGSEGLLDHAALTVTGAGRTVVLPLRVLSAAWKMGFLGPEGGPGPPASGDVPGGIAAGPDDGRGPGPGPAPAPAGPGPVVVVSAAGGWARLAAPYGSAYHRLTPELGVLPG